MTAAEHAAMLPPAATAPPPPTEPLPAIPAREIHLRVRVDAALKRALDVAISAVVLVLLAPLVLLIALLVRLDSHGPVFFRSSRIGFQGRPLAMLKFRKMHSSASGIALTTHEDHRFTRIGAFLQRTKLDELPQFWHVLTGDMSIVGPRPETRSFVLHHAAEYRHILSVRPGLVGLSQLAFFQESRILDGGDPLTHYLSEILPQKVKLDIMYAQRRSLMMDLRIVIWSIAAVFLRRQVAVHRSSGRLNLRRR
jgi:lipopolysaccharide/colanic/teichoic acid biosynthesis glycosyltransferase